MKAFLLKNKWTIIYWLTLSILFWVWEPNERDYYLEKDIAHFKSSYLLLILIGVGAISSLLLFIVSLLKTRSFKNSVVATLLFCIYIILPLFLMQSFFLSGCLFLNRAFKISDSQKPYVVNYWAGVQKNKNSFYLYDISDKTFITDPKTINRLYKPGLSEKDTTIFNFNKGLFGINYFPKSISTK